MTTATKPATYVQKQFVSYLLARGLGVKTAAAYAKDVDFIRRFSDQATPLDVTRFALDDVFSRKLSPARLQRLKHSWNAFADFATKRLQVDVPHAEYRGRVQWKPKGSLEPDQRKAVMAAAVAYRPRGERGRAARRNPTPGPSRHGLAVLLLLYTGLRAAEARSIRVSDFDGRTLTILGKGGKTRQIPISNAREDAAIPSGAEVIAALSEGLSADAPLLGGWTEDLLYTTVASVGHEAGRLEVTPHTLRRAYATDLRRAGFDLEVIRGLLGHSSIATTQRYLGLSGFDLDRVRDALDARGA